MCRDEKRYTNVGQLLPSQENKELEREKFEHSLIFKRIEKKKIQGQKYCCECMERRSVYFY